MEKTSNKRGISLKLIHGILVVLSLSLSVSLVIITRFAESSYRKIDDLSNGYIQCTQDIQILDETSDYLTSKSREYVAIGNAQAAADYIIEINEKRTREKSLENVNKYFANTDVQTLLENALDSSNRLADKEVYAMRLVGDVYGFSNLPDAIKTVSIREEDVYLTDEEKKDKAINMVFGDDYSTLKGVIDKDVEDSLQLLISITTERKTEANNNLIGVLIIHEILGISMLLIVLALGVITYILLLIPLKRSIEAINENKRIDVYGSKELNIVVKAYNEMFENNQKQQKALQYEVSHDILTGISNRHEYTSICNRLAKSNVIYIIADVDKFKGINDTFGHAIGDQVLSEVARKLRETFLNHDRVFRVGGDEFIIFVEDVSKERKKELELTLEDINNTFAQRHEYQGFPLVSLSFGVVEKDENMTFEDAYRRADKALYKVKATGGCGFEFYHEEK